MEKIEFSILRDVQRRPTVTVCTIWSNGEKAIGTAIRSTRDNPVERIGKAKAYGRAKKALYHRKNSLPIFRYEALKSMEIVQPSPVNFQFKSVFCEEA